MSFLYTCISEILEFAVCIDFLPIKERGVVASLPIDPTTEFALIANGLICASYSCISPKIIFKINFINFFRVSNSAYGLFGSLSYLNSRPE